MEATTRLGLPLLSPGQSQKEVVHNEALLVLDDIVAGCVEGPVTSPPADPQAGQAYLVGQGATGEWSGLDGKILSFTPGGWRQRQPVEGLTVKLRSSGVDASYRNGEWELGVIRANRLVIGGLQVVGSRAGAIEAPSGGTVADIEARACLSEILGALRSHGMIATS